MAEVIGADSEPTAALAAYLDAVDEHLSRWDVHSDKVCVYGPTPDRGLAASMVLRRAPRTDKSGGDWDEVAAGWHEELGWWINADSDSRWRPYWLGVLFPAAATAAATLVTALTKRLDPDAHSELDRDGSPHVLRYRSADIQVLHELRGATT